MKITMDHLGRIVIPLEIQKKLNLSPKTVFEVTCKDRAITITPFAEEPSQSSDHPSLQLIK